MMMPAHANLGEDVQEWTRRKFTTCQVSEITFSSAAEEVPPRDDSPGNHSSRTEAHPETLEQEQQETGNQDITYSDPVEEVLPCDDGTGNYETELEAQPEALPQELLPAGDHVEQEEDSQGHLHTGIVRQISGPKKSRILEKKVSFPSDESQLVINLEPPSFDIPEVLLSESPDFNPIDTYTLSCQKNDTQPVESIVEQLRNLDLGRPRSNSLTLRGLTLDSRDCESLEDVLKNIPLKMLDLTESKPDEEGLVALFDMIEFYEAATHVSIAANRSMSSRGWQACCRMIKRSECLEWLDAAGIALSEHTSNLLARALRSNSRLRVLYLNGCGLTGRPLYTIASSLKLNHNLRELHLAENKLNALDALQLSTLLTGNESIQHVDLRNNEIQDQGLVYLCSALQDNTGLTTLVMWNNGITRESSSALGNVLATNRTLQTLNLGHNALGDEGVIGFIEKGLKTNRSLLHLGLQENGLTCTGVIALAESLAAGCQLQRVDLRKNRFALAGLMALASTLKHCPTVTQVDLNPDCEMAEGSDAQEFKRLVEEISKTCSEHAGPESAGDQPAHHVASANPVPDTTVADDAKIPRKVSLTCLVPPNDSAGLRLPLSPTKEEDEATERVPKKWRSPLPSPMPSPSRSPLPSPSSRFKVTRVELDASPLPSPRSRFTVTPVNEYPPAVPAEPSANRSDSEAQDCASFIRSSPTDALDHY